MNSLDSTFPIDFIDPARPRHEAARAWMEAHQEVPIYAVTFALWEVLRGAARLDGVEGVESLRAELEWLAPLSVATASEAATIEAELREDGEDVDAPGYPIAGTARNAGATLVTADPDFERVRDLDPERYASGD